MEKQQIVSYNDDSTKPLHNILKTAELIGAKYW